MFVVEVGLPLLEGAFFWQKGLVELMQFQAVPVLVGLEEELQSAVHELGVDVNALELTHVVVAEVQSHLLRGEHTITVRVIVMEGCMRGQYRQSETR